MSAAETALEAEQAILVRTIEELQFRYHHLFRNIRQQLQHSLSIARFISCIKNAASLWFRERCVCPKKALELASASHD